jgi:hypothetical protein
MQGAAASAAKRGQGAQDRAQDLAQVIGDLRAAGAVSLRDLAAGLNTRAPVRIRGYTGDWSVWCRIAAELGMRPLERQQGRARRFPSILGDKVAVAAAP